ncbi:MAG TPA: rhomboid family intramembrane serine protease [Chitinophagales bacterium]|nr:rhomboid family intramembrane serine protease [Chitinophagales bacterium]HMZ88979.1 rhomboid family intramembrane serine protease [Chitinophagales bacterium]HNE46319.1 rhomboid family intramembrane serine protease [Chitinophagales bacterium]HNJ87961.1 rhomboid family intramembrane serine protease [Chitinophagales bacterium]HNK96631.1 rhomboid family intramembrane serine protease [Chitinophagales bacterium]
MAFFSFTNISTGDNSPQLEKHEEQKLLFLSIFMPVVFIAIMWIVHIFEYVTGMDLGKYGILPKHIEGLPGILFSPFIHGDWQHLISNTAPFLILSFLMIFNYRKVAFKAFVFIYLAGGLLLWLTGRENYHIGASGLIYGMAFFIFFSGVFRKNLQAIALSLFVVFLYGSIVWGMFPIDFKISWEGHAMGAVCGFVAAFYFRNVDRPAPIILEDDPEDDDEMIPHEHEPIEITYTIVDDKPRT